MNTLIVICLLSMVCCLISIRRAEKAEEEVRQLKTRLISMAGDNTCVDCKRELKDAPLRFGVWEKGVRLVAAFDKSEAAEKYRNSLPGTDDDLWWDTGDREEEGR